MKYMNVSYMCHTCIVMAAMCCTVMLFSPYLSDLSLLSQHLEVEHPAQSKVWDAGW